MEGTIGEIRIFASNFPPRDWMYCQGQILPLNRYTALYAILGTNYGGNGTSTFALPDFAGRVAVGVGLSSASGNQFQIGQVGGAISHTLITSEMPAHNHAGTLSEAPKLMVSAADANLAVAIAGSVIATPGYTVADGFAKTLGFNNATPDTALHADSLKVNNTALTLAQVGGSTPHNNMQPYLALNHIICLTGNFPARN